MLFFLASEADPQTESGEAGVREWLTVTLSVTSLCSLSLLVMICICVQKTRDNIRLRFKDAEDCFKQKALFQRNDTNNNSSKETANSNGSLSTIKSKENGPSPVIGQGLQPGNGFRVDRQMSRDRELPPVPSSVVQCDMPVGMETRICSTDYEVVDGGPERQVQSSSCGRRVTSANGELPRGKPQLPGFSVSGMNCDSVSDVQSEVDPLYATVNLTQGHLAHSGHWPVSLTRNSSGHSSSIHSTPSTNWRHPNRLLGRGDTVSLAEHMGDASAKSKVSTPLYARVLRPSSSRTGYSGPPGRSGVSGQLVYHGDMPEMNGLRQSESYSSIAGPPIPSRSYGQSEIDLVVQARNRSGEEDLPIRGDNSVTLRNQEGQSVNGTGSSRRLSQPLLDGLRDMIAASQSGLTQRHSFTSAYPSNPPANSTSGDPIAGNPSLASSGVAGTNQSSSGPYHRVSVRESLASLRARNALPTGPINIAVTCNLNLQHNSHLSQVYEGLYEGLYYSSDEGRGEWRSRFSGQSHAEETGVYTNRAFDTASESYAEIPDENSGQHTSNGTCGIFAEMRDFRHMDSDLDVSRMSTPQSLRRENRSPIHPWYLPRYRPLLPPPSPPPLRLVEARQRGPLPPPMYHPRPIMTPLMERSMEGSSIFDENRNSTIDSGEYEALPSISLVYSSSTYRDSSKESVDSGTAYVNMVAEWGPARNRNYSHPPENLNNLQHSNANDRNSIEASSIL